MPDSTYLNDFCPAQDAPSTAGRTYLIKSESPPNTTVVAPITSDFGCSQTTHTAFYEHNSIPVFDSQEGFSADVAVFNFPANDGLILPTNPNDNIPITLISDWCVKNPSNNICIQLGHSPKTHSSGASNVSVLLALAIGLVSHFVSAFSGRGK